MSATDEEILSFATANNTATHLGRRLYSSAPPAIAELIANSYDAYATECNVILEQEQANSRIIIADNGVGMDFHELQEKYEKIGQQKKAQDTPQGFMPRSPMGKKGIGKLAAFSLGDSYTVYVKSQENPWRKFTLDYREMIQEQNSQQYSVPVSACSSLPLDLKEFDHFEHGMIVVITQLRRAITGGTISALQKQLTRRFFLKNSDFSLKINGSSVDLSNHQAILYDKIKALIYLGYTKNDIYDMFGSQRLEEQSSDPLRIAKFSLRPTEPNYDNLIEMEENNHVRAWIGVINKPKSLKKIGLGGVVVYINGKVADEDFLKNNKDARLGGQYICGEIQADYLNDSDEEPITSSRQGLDESNLEVEKLIQIAYQMQSKAIEQWNKLREVHAVDALPEIIKENEEYRNWRHSLSSDQRKLNNQLLKTLSVKKDFDDEDELTVNNTISLVNSFTQIVEASKLPELSRKLLPNQPSLSDVDESLEIIARYMSTVAISEKLSQASLIEKRLGAIHTLEELMNDSSTKEKAFQKHLFENPWLINPFWNQSTRSDDEIKIQREFFVKLYNEQEDAYKKQFIDIYLEVADEPLPIVVELKKNNPTGHAKVKWADIIDQIDRYRKALLQRLSPKEMEDLRLTANDYQKKIQGYFIISEDTGTLGQGNTITLDDAQRENIAHANIKLMTYSDLVKNAKKAYREFIKDIEDHKGKVPYIPLNETEDSDLAE